MSAITSQITSLTIIVYSIVYSDADQRKHQSSASQAFVSGIQRRPVNSPHKWPVKRKMVPFDDVIMSCPVLSADRIRLVCQTLSLINNMSGISRCVVPHCLNEIGSVLLIRHLRGCYKWLDIKSQWTDNAFVFGFCLIVFCELVAEWKPTHNGHGWY